MTASAGQTPEAEHPDSDSLRVLCITDSLGLKVNKARPEGEPDISFFDLAEKTLRESGHQVTLDVRPLTGRTAKTAHQYLAELAAEEIPEYVLFHVGVVDCAPRIFGLKMRWLIGQIRPRVLRNLVFSQLRKLHSRWFFKTFGHRVFLSSGAYESWMGKNLELAREKGAQRVLFSSILPTTSVKESIYLGFKKNIHTYNQVLEDIAARNDGAVVRHREAFADLQEPLLYDGIHPTLAGKELLGRSMARQLQAILESGKPAFPAPVPRAED